MRERREASTVKSRQSQSSEDFTDDSAHSLIDVSSQDEDADTSAFIKAENVSNEAEEEQESHETEPEMPTPVESPKPTQRRTKKPTEWYGIDLVNDEEEEENEDMRRKIRESLRIFEDQRRKKAEVKERKALINQCMKRTQEFEMESKKIWEKISKR